MAELLDWMIVPNNPSVTTLVPDGSQTTYDLLNATCSQALKYGERSLGINLLWGDPAKMDSIRFQRESNSSEPIKFEEPLAIYIRGGGYLVYEVRTTGVNLGWSKMPKFEWKILGGPAGTPVPVMKQVGLYNNVEQDSIMYEPRDWGINLKWFKDSGKHDTLVALAKKGKWIKDLYGAIT
jgi:hypothetical protein